MKSNIPEDQRFLLGTPYSEDDRRGGGGLDMNNTSAVERGHGLQYVAGREKQNRIVRDMLVFLLSSILWVAAIFFFLPWPSSTLPPTSHNTSTSAVAAAAALATLPLPMPEVNEQGVMKDTSQFHNVTSGARLVSCGNSTAEALAGGCEYDTLLNAWVPGECFDQEWVEEYEDDGSWAAFEDKNLTQKLAPEDMGTRQYYYTSIRDHVNHCAMLWRKQFWTLFEDRRALDTVIVNPYHTEHCSEFLSNLMTMERTEPTLVKVNFAGCWVKGGPL